MPASTPDALQRFCNRLLQRSALDSHEQAAIQSLPNRAQQFRARSDIVSPGEATGHACLVVDGLVARFDQMSDGKRQIVSFYLPGDMCDLQSVALGEAGWGLETMTTSTVLFVPHGELCRVAMEHMPIALAFWRDTIADASVLAKWVGNLGRRRAGPRVAHLLCELGIRMENAQLHPRTHFHLQATQEQLADATGLTSVHLNRTLKVLRDDGVVLRGGVARIADWNRLAALADFDPTYLLLPEGGPVRERVCA